MISVPGSGNRAGTRDGGIAPEKDSIYVVDAFKASMDICKISCESDPKCVSVTYNSRSTNQQCVKNYGPTIRVITLPAIAGVSSCQPFP